MPNPSDDPLVLQHCIEHRVTIPAPGTGPLRVTVGGASGDGNVEVSAQAGGGGVLGNVPTGMSIDVPLTATLDVWFHYYAGEGKPQAVTVDYVLPPKV